MALTAALRAAGRGGEARFVRDACAARVAPHHATELAADGGGGEERGTGGTRVYDFQITYAPPPNPPRLEIWPRLFEFCMLRRCAALLRGRRAFSGSAFSPSHPLRVCVVGSGPAGFYTADRARGAHLPFTRVLTLSLRSCCTASGSPCASTCWRARPRRAPPVTTSAERQRAPFPFSGAAAGAVRSRSLRRRARP